MAFPMPPTPGSPFPHPQLSISSASSGFAPFCVLESVHNFVLFLFLYLPSLLCPHFYGKKKKKRSQFCLLLDREINYGWDWTGIARKYLENNVGKCCYDFSGLSFCSVEKKKHYQILAFNDIFIWYLWTRSDAPGWLLCCLNKEK